MQTTMSLPARGVATRPARGCVRAFCVAQPQLRAATTAVKKQPETSCSTAFAAFTAVAAPLMFHVSEAAAKGGEYGILEGRTAALVHPAMEFFLTGATLYAGYLGWQWRRTRLLGEEIRALRVSSAATATADGPALPNPLIEQKDKERKELLAGNFKDKHFMWGSLLLAAGVGMAIEGCANTFMRAERLYPGPHLYAGAAICALWALAAAMVPAMQKGSDTARNAHIALNVVQVGLFLSQVPSGLEIVGKVFEFTSWP